MMVTLYTTNCPKCKVLKAKLEEKNIAFETCEDMKTMIGKGFRSSPILEVDGKMMDFMSAVNWVSEV